MADSILRTKSKEFAKNIVFLCRRLKQSGIESALINQLLRCGTSVGANVHEAQYAQGTKDFISKLEIALKECNESEYWLELLYETNSLAESSYCHSNSPSYFFTMRRMLFIPNPCSPVSVFVDLRMLPEITGLSSQELEQVTPQNW